MKYRLYSDLCLKIPKRGDRLRDNCILSLSYQLPRKIYNVKSIGVNKNILYMVIFNWPVTTKNLIIMKKIILLFVFISIYTIGHSQVKVFSSGNTKVGDTGVAPVSKFDVAGVSTAWGHTAKRTGAGATVLVNRTDKSAMIFGAGLQTGFTFDENYHMEIRRNNRTQIEARQLSVGSLMLRGRGDTGFFGMGGVANPAHQLHITGDIMASGVFYPSDKRLKSNVKKYERGLETLMDLDVLRYNYNGRAGIKTNREHIGVYAQDLKKIAPELVHEYVHEEEDEEGNVISKETFLSIDDGAIKYILINSIKDQQNLLDEKEARIIDLENKIEDLFEVVGELKKIAQSDVINESEITLSVYDYAELNQNVPNPFNGYTKVKYVIPSSSKSASMNIFSMSGKLMKKINIEHLGEGELTINASDIPSGTYMYELMVNGKNIETKKMVLSN